MKKNARFSRFSSKKPQFFCNFIKNNKTEITYIRSPGPRAMQRPKGFASLFARVPSACAIALKMEHLRCGQLHVDVEVHFT